MADALAPSVEQNNNEFLRSTVIGRMLRSAKELSIVRLINVCHLLCHYEDVQKLNEILYLTD